MSWTLRYPVRTAGDPPPSCTVLKKSVFPRVLQRFIISHRDLLCKCSLDGKGLYEWTSTLTTEDHVSSRESWWKWLMANKMWQFMPGYLLHLSTWKQINSGFWKYHCILLPFKQNMHFSQVFKLIYTLGSCFWQCHNQMQWSPLLALLPEQLYIETSCRFGCT